MLLLCLMLSVKLWECMQDNGENSHRRYSVNNVPDSENHLPTPTFQNFTAERDDSESQYSKTNFMSACSYLGPLTAL